LAVTAPAGAAAAPVEVLVEVLEALSVALAAVVGFFDLVVFVVVVVPLGVAVALFVVVVVVEPPGVALVVFEVVVLVAAPVVAAGHLT
jgi:hypothetical protein